jgi:uncharacterized protein YecE (DUF72 family)
MTGSAFIGISGWRYPPWRGVFYPKGLPQRSELDFASHHLSSIEINGSFYSLQRPTSYERWRDETPDHFIFSVKGPRYVTHLLSLRNARTAVANFFASGVLALGAKLGPVLWQLPERQHLDVGVLAEFLAMLPATTGEALALAREHDSKLDGRAYLQISGDRPLRHCLEVRHESFATDAAYALLRQHGVAMVEADTAGTWPHLRQNTAAGFRYLRLHGAEELYASGYTDEGLDAWARDIRPWLAAGQDVYVYFDNDTKVRAPFDAMHLMERLDSP